MQKYLKYIFELLAIIALFLGLFALLLHFLYAINF